MLVMIVSRCMADYNYIFDDKDFIEAGWPNALRPRYRLPDSLR